MPVFVLTCLCLCAVQWINNLNAFKGACEDIYTNEVTQEGGGIQIQEGGMYKRGGYKGGGGVWLALHIRLSELKVESYHQCKG